MTLPDKAQPHGRTRRVVGFPKATAKQRRDAAPPVSSVRVTEVKQYGVSRALKTMKPAPHYSRLRRSLIADAKRKASVR